MIAYALERGDALEPGVRDKMVGGIAGALYSGLPSSKLRPLLQSDSATARLVGVCVVLLAGPFAKGILADVRLLLEDPDDEVRTTAGHVIRQAVAVGWIQESS